jgi:tetratricopeptide (TPR) repeat protein
MSLLIKALKQAEQKNPASNGNASGIGNGLSLEPLENPGSAKSDTTNGTQAASNYFAASAPSNTRLLGIWLDPRNWSLVPATLVFALLFGVGYGYYIYLMTRPPATLAASLSPMAIAPKPAAAPAPVVAPTAELGSNTAAKKPEPDTAVAQAGSVPPAPAPAKHAPAPARSVNEPSVAVTNIAAPQINPLSASAYGALQAGRIDDAHSIYQRLAAAEPRNIDAWLGLAAIALQQGHADQAGKYYMQALETDPKNAAAQAGLISLIGSADPLASESRLKALLASQPSAFLYFTLGNLYAGQGKWPTAEQAYFQAQQLDPANADYAFNLAVSLEHLSQPAIALTYYRRAQQFASRTGGVHFDTAGLAARIAHLSSTPSEEKR